MTHPALAKTRTDTRARAGKPRTACPTSAIPDTISKGQSSKSGRAPASSPAPLACDAPSSNAPSPASPVGTKADTLIALLRRREGATIAQMCGATGWLPHSVRGFMAGTLRKRHGLAVVSEKSDSGRVYRIAGDGANA